jgi:hypothetical protein
MISTNGGVETMNVVLGIVMALLSTGQVIWELLDSLNKRGCPLTFRQPLNYQSHQQNIPA